ncbi:SPG20 protein [Apiospora hydei]|uniref:SPG20 protein n=1 Tax=Apiospora hydei TaxID=1337664 RepID=A0ABR1WCT7_9PEZI
MASGHNLLYAIQGVSAYHVTAGKEESLTPTGPQTLSLLMVPTSSSYADPAAIDGEAQSPSDFYLHLHVDESVDIPLPATTQIYHQPPRSYLIPRWDLGPESGAFTRLEFPEIGSRKGLQEDGAAPQCGQEGQKPPTATSAAAGSPTSSKSKMATKEEVPPYPPPAYNPAAFAPGEAYAQGSHSAPGKGGQIVLVDEEDGSVIGELGEGYQIDDNAIKPGSKEPVEITLPTEGGKGTLAVAPASPEFLEMELHPAYKKSFLVSKATYASRLIVTTSDLITKGLQTSADSFTQKTKPADKAVTFTPTTHDRVRRIGKFSGNVADLSSKTVGQVSKVAQNLGASLARKKDKDGSRGFGADGKPIDSYKPGLLNKSMMAFSTIADGIDYAGRNLLASGSSAATNVVTHKWGNEAGELSKHLGGSVKNVGLVYIDVTGVSRRAIVKAVGKGMVVGRVKGGGEIVVGDDTSGMGGDGDQVAPKTKSSPDLSGTSSATGSVKGKNPFSGK